MNKRKNASAANIREDSKNNYYELSTNRPVSSKPRHSPYLKSHHQDSLPTLFSSNSNSDFSSFLLTKGQTPRIHKEDLYEETLQLKREMHRLKSQISIAKSDNRKKDVELVKKEKAIDDCIDDSKANHSLIDKLVDSNILSKLKKDYKQLKVSCQDQKNKNESMKQIIKQVKLNQIKLTGDKLKSTLIQSVTNYNSIQAINKYNGEKMQEMLSFIQLFQTQHNEIDDYQKRLNESKEKIKAYQEQINYYKEQFSYAETTMKKQRLEQVTLKKKNNILMNEKKSKDNFIYSKSTYEKKIEEYEAQLNIEKDKMAQNEKTIKELEAMNTKLEKAKDTKTHKLSTFNYNKYKYIEPNPAFKEDTKVLLVKSLINESYQRQQKLRKEIGEYAELLKHYNVEVSQIINEDHGINEQHLNETHDKPDENTNPNNKHINDSEHHSNSTNNQHNKSKNDNDNDNNQSQSHHSIEANKETNMTKDNNRNVNNNNSNSKSAIPVQNIDSQISKSQKSGSKDLHTNIQKIEKELTSSIQKNDTKLTATKKELTPLNHEELNEFTYVLIKNFEAKEISFEKAQSIFISEMEAIDSKSKSELIDILTLKLTELLKCTLSQDIEKISTWIYTLFPLCNENKQKVIENILTILANGRSYTSEEDLILRKKVKKSLLPFKKIIETKMASPIGYISCLALKKLMEEEKIEMKDDYAQFLFYKMKQFNDSNGTTSLYDLKITILFDILNDDLNDSKMNEKTESEIEISNDEYVQIITNFVLQLNKVLFDKKLTLQGLLKNNIQEIEAQGENEKYRVIEIEKFIQEMNNVNINLSNELEIYCIFSRYKISEEYELISIDLLEKELENFRLQEGDKGKMMEDVAEENNESTNSNKKN